MAIRKQNRILFGSQAIEVMMHARHDMQGARDCLGHAGLTDGNAALSAALEDLERARKAVASQLEELGHELAGRGGAK